MKEEQLKLSVINPPKAPALLLAFMSNKYFSKCVAFQITSHTRRQNIYNLIMRTPLEIMRIVVNPFSLFVSCKKIQAVFCQMCSEPFRYVNVFTGGMECWKHAIEMKACSINCKIIKTDRCCACSTGHMV